MEYEKPPYYPYPAQAGSGYYEGEQEFERIQNILRSLHERKQRLLMNLQTNPHQRHEIESQLRQVDRETQHCQQQLGPAGMDPMQYNAYGHPKGGNPSYMMSPGSRESAFGSGVPSGGTTTDHSVVAGNDLEEFACTTEEETPRNYTYQGYPESQHRAANVQGREERIRTAMFTDGIEEVPSGQIMMGQQPTNVQRLAQPAQILKATLSNLASYQSSTEMTSQLLPELAKLLAHPEEIVVLEASKLLLELSKKEASHKAIVANGEVITCIIRAMASTMKPDIQKALAGTLHNLSNDRQGLIMIYNCGGIPYLVRLLTSQVDGVLFYGVTTLHNLLLHYDPAKMDVRLAGGLEKMVALLVKDNPKFLAITADCLHILAYGHQDSKLIILASGGPALLVRIMRLYAYEKLLWTCSRLLKVLSVCPSNKPEIVQAGGMQALGSHLGHRSSRLVQNILFTIRNLSDAATKQDHLDDLLRHLITLLGSNEFNIVTCSAGVLSNLTCNNAKNKTIVFQLHGVEALLRAINNAGGREEIVESAICTLRHITSRHPSAEMAQNAVREQNGIQLLVGHMQHQYRWPLFKALIGLFRNLSLCTENLGALREQGCIPKLWQLLNKAYQDSHRRTGPGAPPGFIDGVYMDEIVEVSVGALHLLARDPNNRSVIRQLNSISFFVQLLYSQTESITRVAAGVLCELAQDVEGATQIQRENAVQPLTELLHSRNEGIAAYAAAVLFCLSEDNPRNGAAVYRNEGAISTVGGQMGYFGGSSLNPVLPPGQTPVGHTPIDSPHIQSLSGTGYNTPRTGYSTPRTGYSTPGHDISGILTPDLDLPLDIGAFDDLAVTDTFPPHTPTAPTPHTHHYTAHQPQMPLHQQSLHPQPAQGNYPYSHHNSYNPPSPAIMETTSGPTTWLDTDL